MLDNENNDLITKLNENTHHDIPDLKNVIKAKYLQQERKQNKGIMKKVLYFGSLFSLLIALITVMINKETFIIGGGNSDSTTSTDVAFTPVTLQTKKDQIAYMVLSNSNFITSNDAHTSSLLVKNRLSKANNLSESEYKTKLDSLNTYMMTLESMLSTSFNIESTLYPSDIEGYAYKMEVIEKLIDDNYKIKTLYYNEEKLIEEDDDDDDYDEDEESYFIINGFFIDNESTTRYLFEASKQIDSEDGEVEFECKTYLDDSKKNYIYTNEETEINDNGVEEKEYCYKVYKNSKVVSEAEIKYGKEDYQSTAFINIKSDNNKKDKYKIHLNEEVFVITSSNQSPLTKFYASILIDETATSYKYYNDQFNLVLKRN